MKKYAFVLAALVSVAAFADDMFCYSEDGATAGSGERMLPVQAVNKATGKVVFHLRTLTDAERADCCWYRVIAHEVYDTNLVFTCTGHVFHADGPLKGTCDQIGRETRKPTYRTYTFWSKWQIFQHLSALGKWDAFEAWLTATTIGGVNLRKAWDMVQVVGDDNALFNAVKQQACAAVGMTESEMDAVLAQCVDYTEQRVVED